MYNRYSGDPYWTTARYNSTCGCGDTIKKGTDIFYYPNNKKALCKVCGENAYNDFRAMAQDEYMYSHG
uniref:Uncharacterized protein n=2 Tax=viral metagenome TaxID=1070528 RepID=A0A6H1ZVF8_9ZZZZ